MATGSDRIPLHDEGPADHPLDPLTSLRGMLKPDPVYRTLDAMAFPFPEPSALPVKRSDFLVQLPGIDHLISLTVHIDGDLNPPPGEWTTIAYGEVAIHFRLAQ